GVAAQLLTVTAVPEIERRDPQRDLARPARQELELGQRADLAGRQLERDRVVQREGDRDRDADDVDLLLDGGARGGVRIRGRSARSGRVRVRRLEVRLVDQIARPVLL